MFLHPTMLLRLSTPLIFLVLSILTFHFALHSRTQTHRYFFLPPFLLFATLSLTSSVNWLLIPNLTSLWTQAMALNIPHIICVLYIRPHFAPLHHQTFYHKFSYTWRVWCNPQMLHLTRSEPQTISSPSKSAFLASRAVKLLLYYLLNATLLPLLTSHLLATLHPTDLVPRKQSLLRRIPDVSRRDLLIRTHTSVFWIVQSVIYLDGANALLALFFVGTGIDRPCDWPRLFGRVGDVTSLRAFWARFWHGVAVRPYTDIGRAVARTCGLRGRSMGYNVVVAFVIFGLSGVSHGVVSWRIGRDGRRDVWWFMLNFMACVGETVGGKWIGRSNKLQWLGKSPIGTFIGRAWVFVFFFWSVPKWQYPAMYKDAVQARQMAAFELIFSKMQS